MSAGVCVSVSPSVYSVSFCSRVSVDEVFVAIVLGLCGSVGVCVCLGVRVRGVLCFSVCLFCLSVCLCR